MTRVSWESFDADPGSAILDALIEINDALRRRAEERRRASGHA